MGCERLVAARHCLYRLLKQPREAEKRLQRALLLRQEELGPHNLKTAGSMTELALVHLDLDQFDEAQKLLLEAIRIREASLGRDHISLAYALDMLGAAHRGQGQNIEASEALKRALSIRLNTLGANHPDTAKALRNLGGLYFKIEDWANAVKLYEEANKVILSRRDTHVYSPSPIAQGQVSREVERHSHAFVKFVRAAHRLARAEPDLSSVLKAKSFEAAQWARLTRTSQSLAKLAARFGAAGTNAAGTDLAKKIREQHDLTLEWKKFDAELVRRLSKPAQQRDAVVERRLRSKIDQIESRLDTIANELDPSYLELSQPRALSLSETQASLRPLEVLVSFTFSSDEGYIWAVTKREVRWRRLAVGRRQLSAPVARLRCGLDSSNWIDASRWPEAEDGAKRRKHAQTERRERCARLTATTISEMQPPPFDPERAHELFKLLFSEIEDLIEGRDLIVVPDGSLTTLPFQVLVKREPRSGQDLASIDWLIRDHAITVLPSVSSLKALRHDIKTSQATQAFLGFGNPLLSGPSGNDRRAWAKQSCSGIPDPAAVQVANLAQPESVTRMYRGGAVDVAKLKRQVPLPETAVELCTVAGELGADDSAVHLGSEATETKLYTLNREGALAKARVLHFATHGLIARETESLARSFAEPSLMMTPPGYATDVDDGLLTASEVAALKLDANWVVLSACNTAAGGEKGDTEALSGLARAFFYAGARALLVSHWYVDSHAAVRITTRTFAELKRDANIGRAKALRRAMLAVMRDTTRPKGWIHAAHPAVWAPFVIVGEGGVAMQAAR